MILLDVRKQTIQSHKPEKQCLKKINIKHYALQNTIADNKFMNRKNII